MKSILRPVLLFSVILCWIGSNAQQSPLTIPAGTILPVQLNSTVKSNRARPGQIISARIMQEVPLPGHARIPRGAKVIGQVVTVRPVSAANKAEISLRFDMVATRKQRVPVTTHLRAMASLMAVSQAQVPEFGPDRGTPPYIWTTELIGGQVDYHGGGLITEGNEVVGHSTADGVLVRPGALPGTRCRNAGDSDGLQAFWVFSYNACGIYDYDDLSLIHAGRTEPRGQFTVQVGKGNVDLRSGSGLLLRVQ